MSSSKASPSQCTHLQYFPAVFIFQARLQKDTNHTIASP